MARDRVEHVLVGSGREGRILDGPGAAVPVLGQQSGRHVGGSAGGVEVTDRDAAPSRSARDTRQGARGSGAGLVRVGRILDGPGAAVPVLNQQGAWGASALGVAIGV